MLIHNPRWNHNTRRGVYKIKLKTIQVFMENMKKKHSYTYKSLRVLLSFVNSYLWLWQPCSWVWQESPESLIFPFR